MQLIDIGVQGAAGRTARDIVDEEGRRILPAGTRLTTPLIRQLVERGVRQVWVFSADGSDSGMSLEQKQAVVAQCRAELRNRFAHAPQTECMRVLFDAVLKIMVRERLL